ncbi:MAG: GlsB/YeaQ/YmgE family stress response membrane protein [Clostridiales bacterium]|nr:GlsB/YeaQ/YmgE family stress response membrane protein [Clostridiales bacterium]
MGLGIIGWIVIGAVAGWIASMITGNNRKMGAGKNIIAGIIGGFVGGLVMNLLGGEGTTGFNLWSLLVATAGAVIVLLIVNAVKRPT